MNAAMRRKRRIAKFKRRILAILLTAMFVLALSEPLRGVIR